MTVHTVAIVQHPPAVLDLQASLYRAAKHIREAANAGASLVVFPETWLTCYPAWVFGMAGWDDDEARYWHGHLLRESPALGGATDMDDDLAELRAVAAECEVTVVMGLNERSPGGGTLYNSLATIGPDGILLNLHRKLMPTHTERIVWGIGDAQGLRAVDTPVGRVGGLICWEHWMPPARQTLHASGEHIHVASWPDTSEMHLIASRHYAFEGRCFVLAAGLFITEDDVPENLRDAFRRGTDSSLRDQGLFFDGGSSIISPNGSWVIEPVRGKPAIIVSKIDLSRIDGSVQDLDTSGHYSRSDLFELSVNAKRPHGVVRHAEVSDGT